MWLINEGSTEDEDDEAWPVGEGRIETVEKDMLD